MTGPRTLGRYAAVAVLYLLLIKAVFGLSPANLVSGVALGSLYGIIAVAIILIHRTTRVINFAAAAVGAVPALFALMLDVALGWSYLLVVPIAIFGGAAFGAATDAVVLRRFDRSPRLIVTVVTIGIAQTFGAIGIFVPSWFGQLAGRVPQVPTPWAHLALHNGRGEPVLSGNQLFAFLVVVASTVGLTLFLRSTRTGVGLRAAAQNPDQAALLGIPTRRLSTIAWAVAGALAAVAIFAQAPLIGVPANATLGFETLLYALAAAVVARMERMGVALGAGAAIGILIFSSIAKTGTSELAAALMLVVVLGALLFQRRVPGRLVGQARDVWEAATSARPVPKGLRDLPEVRGARHGLAAIGLIFAVALPYVVGRPRLPALAVLPLYGIVGVSLVVLTGWAGQVSLGQFGLVGMGAAVAGGLVANHNVDFFLALALGIAAGAVTAVVIGLPALRIQGLYLAVTTLAFGYCMERYVFNKRYFVGRLLLPHGYTAHLERPALYGWIDLENGRTFYLVCLCLFLLTVAAAHALRRNRSGRLFVAARDNARAAEALGISAVRSRLAAFAIAGALAGLAGVLFAYQQHNVIPETYGVAPSIAVFLAAAIGGLTSVWCASLTAIAFEAVVLFGPSAYGNLGHTVATAVPLLLSGPLLVTVLYFNPAGVSERAAALRDRFLRWVADRHGVGQEATRDDSAARSLSLAVEQP